MLTLARVVVRITVLLVPLFVWPGASRPFFTPRLVLIGASVATTASLLTMARTPWLPWPPVVAWSTLAWLGSLGMSAALAPHASMDSLVVPLAAVAWGAVLSWSAIERRAIAATLTVSATVVGAWAVLQWLEIDLFEIAGWRVITPGSPRMRVYASLGNPNFVGAFLAAALPVSLTLLWLRPSSGLVAAAALQLAGIAATSSRGAWLGTIAGVGFALMGKTRPKGAVVASTAAAVLLVGLAVWLGPARPIGETLRGRIYIWSVAAPHLLDHPVTGFGPGGFAVEYPAWQAERLGRGVDDDVRRYLTPTRHAHNDYLEALVESGIPGLVSWLALVGAVVCRGWRPAAGADGPLARGAAAGVAALAAVAVVDFPFARSVETITWWTLAVMAVAPGPREPPSAPATG